MLQVVTCPDQEQGLRMGTMTVMVTVIIQVIMGAELQWRFFEDFVGGICKESIIGWEPVSIVH